MKKIFIKFIAVAVITTAFAGCGKKEYLEDIKAKDYVKISEYKGLEVTQAHEEITEEYRDSYINYLLSLNPADGVKEGDTVNIDYEGKLDGVPFEGGTAAGQNLGIGSGQFIPGFEEGLIGAKVGETRDLNITFPEEYQNVEMAGKAVVFTVTVNTIMAAQPQELTDEYVQGLDIECSTVEDYKQYVYDRLVEEENAAYETDVENSLVTSIMESSEFIQDPPQEMQERYIETLTANLTAQAAEYGKTLEEFMMLYYGMDASTYVEEIKVQALDSAKHYILLQAIADEEKIVVTKEELQAEMEEMAAQSSYETVEEFKEAVNAKGYREYMLGMRVMDMLRENAIITQE